MSLHRAALSFALTLAPIVGTGCVTMSSRTEAAQSTHRSELRMNAARLEENRGNLAHAKRLYLEIHQNDPRNADCLHHLGAICTRLNQHAEADIYYGQAFAINPNNPELLADMGYVAFLKKDYEQSEKLLEQSVKLKSNDPQTINNLAIVQAWREKDEASLAGFRRIHSEVNAIRQLAAIQFARGDQERGKTNTELANSLDKTSAPVSNAIAQNPPNPSVPIGIPAPLPPMTASMPPGQARDLAPPPHALGSSSPTQAPIQQSTQTPVSFSKPSIAEEAREFLDRFPQERDASTPRHFEAPIPSLIVQVVRVTAVDSATVASDDPETVPLSVPEITPEPSTTVEQATNETEFDLMLPSIATGTEETQKYDSDENTSFKTPSIWRKTPLSRGGSIEGVPYHLNQLDVPQISTSSTPASNMLRIEETCLVTLIEERRITRVLDKFSCEFRSRQYRFSSSEALAKFRLDPEKYVPAVGGLDIVSVRNERSAVPGSLSFAIWYRRQLYLFSSSQHAEAFRREPQRYVSVD